LEDLEKDGEVISEASEHWKGLSTSGRLAGRRTKLRNNIKERRSEFGGQT
jgi:hypothetical protein